MRLANILNEMAMKSTLEREFTKIVKSLHPAYVKDYEDRALRAIEYNKEFVMQDHGNRNKTYDTLWSGRGRFGPNFIFHRLFKQFVFIQKGSLIDYRGPLKKYGSVAVKVEKELNKIHDWGYWGDRMDAGDITPKEDEERRAMWERRKAEEEKYVILPKQYWMPELKKQSKEAGKFFYDSFIKKNVAKFTGVIKGKDIEKMHHQIVHSNLTGFIYVTCEDKSGFNVSFSIETSISSRGKLFNRFPTRFHNVTLADGSKLKNPSEKKMKQDF